MTVNAKTWKPACPDCGRHFIRIGNCTWQNACKCLDVDYLQSHRDEKRDENVAAKSGEEGT